MALMLLTLLAGLVGGALAQAPAQQEPTLPVDHLYAECRGKCGHAQAAMARLGTPGGRGVFSQAGFGVDIVYHRLELRADPAVRYIGGWVTTYFRALVPTDTLRLDLNNALRVDSVRYRAGMAGTGRLAYRHFRDLLSIGLPTTLPVGAIDSLTVYYQGVPPIGGGFGAFATSRHAGVPVMWTLSEPYGAPEWWPCKSDLTDKIDSLDFVMTIPSGNRVGSNGLLIRIDTLTGGELRYHWRHRYPIVTYLVAFAATNYTDISYNLPLRGGQLLMQHYVYPESVPTFGPQVRRTDRMLQIFDSTFHPYPYDREKYGHAQFGWGGGMEHATMSFMANFDWYLVAHELAHQWFGDMVTCGSWRDIWLNEGFASYSEALSYEFTGQVGTYAQWRTQNLNGIMSQPGGSVWVDDTTSVNRIFNGRLSYAKGAYLLHMLRYRLGNTAFFAGIRNYLADPTLNHGFARTADLQRHLEAVSGQSLTRFFQEWYRGQGYPRITIEGRQGPGTEVTLTLNQATSHPSVWFFETPVPVRLRLTNGTTRDYRLDGWTQNGQSFIVDPGAPLAEVIPDPNQWILARYTVSTVTAAGSRAPRPSLKAHTGPNSWTITGMPSAEARYALYDLTGRKIRQGRLFEGAAHVPAPAMPGVYLLEVEGAMPLRLIRPN